MGTVHVILHRATGFYRIAAPGTAHTAEETYKVWWTPSDSNDAFIGIEALIIAASDADLGVRVPRVQERAAGCADNGRFWVVTNHDWRADPAAPYTYTVTVHYANQLPFQYGTGWDPTKPWTRITRTVGFRQAQLWRDPYDSTIAGWAVPPATQPWPPTTDIGGRKIDINGQPTTMAIPQCTITLEWHWHRGFSKGSDSGSGSPVPLSEPPAYLANSAATRNAKTFLGYGKGQVLFAGYSVSPVDPQTYLFQYRFIWDAMAHHEQKVAPNVGTAANLEVVSSTFIGNAFKQASKVGWFQPFPRVEDWETTILPSDVWAAATTVYPPHNTCTSLTGGLTEPTVLPPPIVES